jgi:hypothetical protein
LGGSEIKVFLQLKLVIGDFPTIAIVRYHGNIDRRTLATQHTLFLVDDKTNACDNTRGLISLWLYKENNKLRD